LAATPPASFRQPQLTDATLYLLLPRRCVTANCHLLVEQPQIQPQLAVPADLSPCFSSICAISACGHLVAFHEQEDRRMRRAHALTRAQHQTKPSGTWTALFNEQRATLTRRDTALQLGMGDANID
jgi:hypothetical protein